MHPGQRDADQHEEEGEAGGVDAGQIEERAEDDRQHEAAEAADHADKAADRTDVVGIVDRDVLEDRGLAEAHEEAEHEDRDHERHEVHLRREGDRPVLAVDHVVGRRIGQHQQDDHREAERPVHHRPRAAPVREVPAIGAEQAGREREGRRSHAGGADVDAVDVDQIVRQPQRQRHEGAEHEEIVEREAPDLQVPERRQLLRDRRPLARLAPCHRIRVVPGDQPEDHRHRRQRDRPDLRHRLPAPGDHHQRGEELGHGRADVARAEDAERRPLLLLRKPVRDVGHADRERPAGEADAERRQQEGGVAVGMGQRPGRRGGQKHLRGEHHPPAELLGPDAEDQPRERAGQHRGRDQQAELRLAQAELRLDLDADDREDRPDREAEGESQRAQPERPVAFGSRHRRSHRVPHPGRSGRRACPASPSSEFRRCELIYIRAKP